MNEFVAWSVNSFSPGYDIAATTFQPQKQGAKEEIQGPNTMHTGWVLLQSPANKRTSE